MRHIVKSTEPQVLFDYKKEYKERHRTNATYGELPTEVKEKLRYALSKEQYFICCYCMKHVKQDKSHIEHIKPQVQFPGETLNYDNLLVSCNGIQSKNKTCGHKKDGWYNEKDFLSPLDSECENMYTYSISGRMDALQENGKTTIEKLNLNSYQLIQARRAAIKASGFFDDDFEQKKQEILAYNTVPNSDSELPPFCMVVIYCVNNYK
jgi:uncharacterized protein (TIGR02646 family)